MKTPVLFFLGALVFSATMFALTARAEDTPADRSFEPSKMLRVGTTEYEPFVMRKGGSYEGFCVDLWSHIAKKLGVRLKWKTMSTTADMLAAVSSDAVDIGVGGTSVTASREQQLDFSHSFFDAGLQVLVREDSMVSTAGFALFKISKPLVFGLLAFLALIFLSANVIWLFERKINPGEFPSKYWPGVWEAFWWSAVTVTTVGYGDKAPRGRLGRAFALIWMVLGIGFLANFTASVSASMTIERLHSDIHGPEDLRGKRVATRRGTTAAEYLRQEGIRAKEYDRIEDAYLALEQRRVDAVVYDAPALRYYASREGRGDVQLVGSLFKHESFALALPSGSPYREAINLELLKFRESVEYTRLYNKWFGPN